jgi:hypothetical protein
VLSGLCTSALPTPYPKPPLLPSQYWWATKAHPEFTYFASQWYTYNPTKVKILPSLAFLETWFTEVSLAFWIMGDGYWSQNSVFICTECFTFNEVRSLQVLLQKKYKLKTILKKRSIRAGVWKNYRLVFSGKKNVEKLVYLVYLVYPHIHASILYKLNLSIQFIYNKTN